MRTRASTYCLLQFARILTNVPAGRDGAFAVADAAVGRCAHWAAVARAHHTREARAAAAVGGRCGRGALEYGIHGPGRLAYYKWLRVELDGPRRGLPLLFVLEFSSVSTEEVAARLGAVEAAFVGLRGHKERFRLTKQRALSLKWRERERRTEESRSHLLTSLLPY